MCQAWVANVQPVYDLPHPGVKRDCCGRFCQQLDRLHEACCLQCSRYPLIQAANDEEGGGRLVGQHTWGPKVRALTSRDF